MAFTNVTLHKTYNQKIENATLLIRDGKVEAAGTGVAIPKGAVVKDCSGLSIYPSFIDLYSDYGLPKVKEAEGNRWNRRQQPLSNKDGAYGWNQAIKPEYNASEEFTLDKKTAKELRSIGFGVVQVHQMDGISRGTGAVVLLGEDNEQESLLKNHSAHFLSFSKGESTQNYPNSLMGSIALIRQTYLDAEWYANGGAKEQTNLSLEAWNRIQSVPQYFETRDRLEALRAANLGKEFGKQYIIRGSGDEYQRINELKQTGASFILPMKFPKAFDVEDPFDAMQADLHDLRHWELAPTNAARLNDAGMTIAFTAHGLKKKDAFLGAVAKTIKGGLSSEAALKALTDTPARLLNMQNQIGSLEPGRFANFIITSGAVFDKSTKLYEHYVKGEAYKIKDYPNEDISGKYLLKTGRQSYDLEISTVKDKSTAKIIVNDSTTTKVGLSHTNDLINLSFSPFESEEVIRLSGRRSGKSWKGKGKGAKGIWFDWQATYQSELTKEEKKDKKEKTEMPIEYVSQLTYPFLPYGWTEQPKAETVAIQGATVWTNESEGIIENATVLITNGKITAVGKDLKIPSGATTIDGKGKHLTSGVIDEHSHIAISKGVNEASQASSAEVSIADVVNSEDINIYRQLGGGVTASQLLHGSANPIGGQSAIIKLRWGLTPEEMKIKGSAPFIKFALGENVKQSRSSNATRFPQTRMGVEQLFVDHFIRAKEYGALKASGKPYRKDLEMETLLEILQKKRFISCHSYVQSEINMLMKVADRFGFNINTFTHILEGYKVADKMAEHGAGGSTFSDWWAYKKEVEEAIPHNAGMMHEQGVVVAINSDDAEMARRLNQEAAKAVKYSGISEEDAWKMVSLNPAKLLHLDDRMGSIKSGKDADLVLWSDNPLSIYAMAEKTWVDGVRYFDRERDQTLREAIASERALLVKKMIDEKNGGGETEGVKRKRKRLYHCDSLEGHEETDHAH